LGLGSATLGKWIPDHKGLFLVIALIFMSLSLYAAIKEKKNNGKNAGLIIFSIVSIITVSLLAYTKIQYGTFL